MADHYEILGLEKSASTAQIRVAYKRLAMIYHPDHNPGNKAAEEQFKLINEAYHILSDPLKKSRYDLRYIVPEETLTYDDYLREQKRSRYYRWQHAQQHSYKIDKEYFRIQGLSFLVFIVIAGLCFTIMHAATYFSSEKQRKHDLANTESLKKVNALFVAEQFDDAFKLIRSLRESDPHEFRFYVAHDSLMSELQRIAELRYNEHNYAAAINHYRVLQSHEEPSRYETIQKIALCQYYLGNYKEALQAMKHLHNQNPDDLVLVYDIGVIDLDILENPKEALQYFTLGKKLFKQNLSKVYGEGFMFAMDPADAPDIYYDIFVARARTNLQLQNFEDARKDCEWAIFLRPELADPYRLRALTNIKAGNTNDVCEDLQRAKAHGVDDASLSRKYCR